MKGFLRAAASLLIVLASGVIAPDVWALNGPLAVAGRTPNAIRSLKANAQVAAATRVTRFLLDSRAERERQTLPHVVVPPSIAASSPRISRLLSRESRPEPKLFVRSLIRVRAPPLRTLNS